MPKKGYHIRSEMGAEEKKSLHRLHRNEYGDDIADIDDNNDKPNGEKGYGEQ